ncbi:hypothetical protein BN7_505 [Wickerhamomyces ciferrii]|uniref:Uncharacterized protein n=1 Tax=Wickerhamomyces ciferrii (strain ATCC 14091 / BCRC 22168 / CBS 111 / JCM 3599 / NBRC 0793 / NRRL Y-1031 F-60-10) TaxID=1206466 RepID=K0KDH0_WICCF|nr:uncharacterized protein BN7_505 [Wickerhamomyces ciferrii]CCH40971.1 hypothetical protein BN7_505 [Wickerhamomyces ciferrii]
MSANKVPFNNVGRKSEDFEEDTNISLQEDIAVLYYDAQQAPIFNNDPEGEFRPNGNEESTDTVPLNQLQQNHESSRLSNSTVGGKTAGQIPGNSIEQCPKDSLQPYPEPLHHVRHSQNTHLQSPQTTQLQQVQPYNQLQFYNQQVSQLHPLANMEVHQVNQFKPIKNTTYYSETTPYGSNSGSRQRSIISKSSTFTTGALDLNDYSNYQLKNDQYDPNFISKAVANMKRPPKALNSALKTNKEKAANHIEKLRLSNMGNLLETTDNRYGHIDSTNSMLNSLLTQNQTLRNNNTDNGNMSVRQINLIDTTKTPQSGGDNHNDINGVTVKSDHSSHGQIQFTNTSQNHHEENQPNGSSQTDIDPERHNQSKETSDNRN